MSAYERLKSKYASNTNENAAKKTTSAEGASSSYEKLKSKYLTSDQKAPSEKYISHIANKYDDWNTRLSKLGTYNPRTWHDSSYYKNYASTTSDLINEGNSLAEYFKTDEKYKDVYDSITKNLTSLNDFSSAITEASDFYGAYKTADEYNKALKDYEEYQKNLNYDTEAGKQEIAKLDKDIETAKKKIAHGAPVIARRRSEEEADSYFKKQGYSYASLAEAEQALADLRVKVRDTGNLQTLDKLYKDAQADNRFIKLSDYGKAIEEDQIVRDYNYQKFYDDLEFGFKTQRLEERELASYLKKDEYDLYTYYLGLDKINGTNEAEKLYEALTPTLKARKSGEIADFYGEDWLKQSAFALYSGVTGWAEDLGTFITAPFRDDDYIEPSVIQQASAQLRENLADDGSWKLPDWLGGGSLSQVSYDIFNTTGRMLPSVLISRGVGTFAPDAAGKLAFGVSMGTSSAGAGYTEMINLGYSKGQALSYGVMVGAAETAMSTLLGSIGGKVGGDGLFAKLSEKALIKIDNAIARVAVTMSLDAASEGVEEALQAAIEPWLKSVATGVDFEAANIDEILYSGLLGAISAFVMEGPGIVGQESLAAQTGGLIKDSEGGIEKIKKLGQGFSADSVAYKIASRVNEKTPASKIGRLFQEIGATITEQNVNDISAALEATGMDAATARRNAKSYAQYINKEVKLTPTGLAMLDSNSPLADAVRSVLIDSNTTPYQRTEEFLRLNAIANGESVPSNTPVVDKSITKEATEALSNAFSSAPSYSPTASRILSQKGYKPIERDNNKDSVTLNDGSKAKILDVVTKDGKIKLRVETSKGVKSVNPNSVNFASENTKALVERVGGLGLDSVSAWSIIKEYKGGDPDLYFNDAYNAYTSGRMGINPSEVETFAINPDVKARLYNTGRAAGKVFSKSAQQNISNKPNNQKNAVARKGSIIFEGNASPKTEIQKKSVAALEKVAKALGITFHLYESTKQGKSFSYKMPDGTIMSASGFYRQANGEIWVDLNAGNKGDGLILYTAAHELTHFIKQWSPEKYKIFADFLLEQYGEKGVSVNALIDRQIAKAERNNRTLSREAALEEVVADSCESFLTDSDALEKIAALRERDKSLVEKIRSFIADLLHKIRSIYSSFAPESTEGRLVRDMTDALEKLHSLWTDALTDASRSYRNLNAQQVNTLAEVGIGVDEVTGEVYALRDSFATNDKIAIGKKSFDVEAVAALVSDATGRSIEDARKWVKSEMTIANLVMKNPEFLDFEVDDRYEAIKKNSDYPQGTVDLSNLCPKRQEFTSMFDMLQKKYPNKLFTASDVAKMRAILAEEGITVACGACFVEDRRQLLGEIADTYINMWKEAVDTGKPLQKTNAEGKKIKLTVTAALAKQYGVTKGADILATDKYIPTQYDLTTYEGFKLLEKNHPTIAMGFNRYNNSRGQQSGRLIEGRAEYKRQILGWSENKVRSVNNNGGLRIFSFSDFEVVHLLDLVQVIIDCAAKGVKIQGYTKIPAFAKLVRNTGIKLNRSFIPKGETGIKVVNGKRVLDIDNTEGINTNDENFLDERDNPDVGNVIIGINPEQIGIAMMDDTIDYIIPFHSNKAKAILRELGLETWVNYKESQHEKDIATGSASKKNVNIYTQVINKYKPTNKVEFVEAFLKECKAQGKIPRYSEFLNVDSNGDYAYREGYHKFLVDFKMFDKEGNILPQGFVTPDLESGFMTDLLNDEVDKKANYEFPQEVYDKIEEQFGEDVQYSSDSVKGVEAKEFSDGDTMFSIRDEEPPKKTIEGYKVFVVKNGKLYPPMVANPNAEDTPVGVWLNADVGARAPDSKTGRAQVKAGGKGTQGGSGSLAFRPGWHLGETPLATQFDRTNPETGVKELFPENFVWALCDVAADHDYQEEAMSYGYTKNGKFQHSLAGLPKLPTDGYYKYRTNPNPDTVPWLITGAMKVKKLLSDAEVNAILKEKGLAPKQRVGGEKTLADLGLSQYEDVVFSDRDPDAITDRELLANVLEASAQTDWEKKKLKEYKAKIAEKEALSRELAEIENKLGKMLKAKGKGSRPRDEIRKLQEDKMNITKKLNIYDNQLLRLESTKALADLATREKNVLKAKMNAKQKAAIKSLKDETANKLKEQRKELMEEKREAISELRSEKNKKIEEIRQEYRESREKMSRQKRETILRGKIRSLYEDLQKALDAPTDNRYIPAELAQSMIDLLGLFDFDTSVIKKDGSVNQAQVRRDEMKLRLQSLKAEYDKLGKDEEESIINEYEKDISDYFNTLADEYGNLKISEIPLEELEDLYDILRSINETLKDARSLLGKSDAETVYKYANEIMEQQNAIIAKRKNHKRSAIQKLSNSLSNMSISTMRNVLRMANFDKDSALYDLFNDLEIGVRNKNYFEMESRKLFEEITKGKNEALYEEALYEPYKGIELTDDKGKKFKVTKMQMMQVILSYEREKANKTTNHVENGGFTFADITKLGKGDLRGAIDKENSHTVTKSGKELAESFAEKLKNDEWAQKYMEVAKKFFNEKAKDAVNEVMLQTKHRIVAKEKNYIPFVVDKAYIVAEIKGNVDVQQTINSYGSLKELKEGSSQPLIITGLNNIIDRHISDVSNIVGLTVPLRNINKVWNSKSKEKDETVKGNVETAWGKSGTKLISQAIADLQSPREDTQPFIYKKIRSGYIGATFLLNGSVVAKQTGSLLSATSMIRYRDPATMLANLGRTMAHFSEIAAEVDKYTASAWMRRQGMSDAEVYSLLTDARKSKITKALNKLPAGVNPAKWITAMDSAVALSLWKYCKEDVKELHPELEGEELNRATAAFYDTVIENTQSMTDVLHRPEIQKSKNPFSESFGMFKTDLFQMAGALQTALDTYKAHPTKANLKALGKTSLAVTSSAIWGQLLTILFAMLRYKMKPYKDDEDELTVESFLTRASFGLASELVGYVMPLFGPDVIKLFEDIAYGETQDAIDNLVISSVNDVVIAFARVAISLTEGEAPDWGQYKKLVTTSLQMFGLPAKNILRTVEAITNHAKDIANGEFLSFNADNKPSKAELLYDAYVNNSADYQQLLEDYSSEESATSTLKQQFRTKEKRVAQAVIASLKGDVEKRVEIAQDIVSEGVFDKDFVTSSVNAEETYLTNKVKELAKYEEEGNTKKAEEILEELVERGYDEDFIDWVKENLEETSGSSSSASSASSYYKASDLKKLVGKKDSADTLELIENLLKEKEEYYKSQGENKAISKNKAKTSVASSLTKYLKPLYLEAWNNKDIAEVRRIKKLMLQSRLYEDVTKTVDGWMVAARKQK